MKTIKTKSINWLQQSALIAGCAVVGGLTSQSFIQGTETVHGAVNQTQLPCQSIAETSPFIQTELFFGLSQSNGTEVSDREFQQFVDRAVTPRFPNGLTLITARGQYKNSQGTLVKERSRLLILLYPASEQQDNHSKIEQIREAYKTAFAQESVLRSDRQTCVSF